MLLLKFIPAITGCHKRSLFSDLGLVCLFVCLLDGWFSLQSSENRLGGTLLSISAPCSSQSEGLSQGPVSLRAAPILACRVGHR